MTLANILTRASNKMVALYKRNTADTSPLSLIKGLVFDCDTFGYSQDGNTITFIGQGNTYTLDATVIASATCSTKPDKYGAFKAKFSTQDGDYIFTFA